MEYATIQLKVPKEMQVYFTDDYAFESNEELKRNALLLSPYIHNNTISHGRAAEILGIKKLDLIESEAIYLSDSKKADILLMDEVRGREVAARMGIKIMGTIGVLGTAFEEKIISKSEIKNAIDILRNSGRHISERLYEQLLNFIESSKNA